MDRYARGLLAAVGVFVVAAGLKACYKPVPDTKVMETRPLKGDERVILTLNQKSGELTQRIVRPSGEVGKKSLLPFFRRHDPTTVETSKVNLPSKRVTSFSVDANGKVTVLNQTKGLIFEPGLAFSYSDRSRLGLDCQVAYYRRWGVSFGALSSVGRISPPSLSFFLAGTYNFYGNTSLFVGLNQRKDVEVGLRIAL